MTGKPTTSRTESELEKFRDLGSSTQGVAVQLYGEDSNGNALPVKVVNDGSNRGKVAVTTE